MSNRSGTPSRKRTDDTLVGSPTISTHKKWYERGWPVKQRSMPSESSPQRGPPSSEPAQYTPPESPEKPMRNISRRASTTKTLVEVPEDKRPFSKAESLMPEDGNSTLVTSPTSFSVSSAFFSPITPSSAIPTLSSAISTSSSSPGISKSQKRGWLFSKKSDKLGGMTYESMRTAALFIARTTLNFAEASNVPYLKGVASIVVLILEYADGAAANNEECFRIINSVSRLLMVLEAKTTELNGKASRTLEHQADLLKASLERVLQDVKQLSDRNRRYLYKFTQMERDKEIIKRCNAELKSALNIFSLQSSIEVRIGLAEFQDQMNKAFREINHRLDQTQGATLAGIGKSELSDEEAQRAFAPQRVAALYAQRLLKNGSLRVATLPPPPAIFLGRTDVLKVLVKSVTQNTAAHIAILGPGGIGKSSLALTVLHHEEIEVHYGKNRFFVPCDSATSAESLISVIATQVGLTEQGKNNNNRLGEREAEVLACLAGAGSGSDAVDASRRPTLIILDNFESPWEPNRLDVEKFLARLAALDNVTLIITLRGTERPSGVKWDRPFLHPLQTLEAQPAREMFLSISDAEYKHMYDEAALDELDELLALCGHLPLAIRLMAELAAPDIDTVAGLVQRWKRATRSTSMLSNGEDPNHSLEVSIELSLDSMRVKRVPEAVTLLGLLAVLPDGTGECDLEIAAPQFQNLDECCMALLKTSLAYRDKVSRRLKVLAPIRAYVSSSAKYQARPNLIKPLENYFWGFIEQAGKGQKGEESIKRALPELGNIESLIERAFASDFEPYSAISAAVNLGQFFLQASLGQPRLLQLQKALARSRQIQSNKLEADCLYTLALTNHRFFTVRQDAATCGDDFLKALVLYEEVDDKEGQGHCLQQLGAVYHAAHRFEDSRDSTEKALQVHQEAGCLGGQASALLNLARILQVMNETKQAIERAHESLGLLRTRHHDPMLEAQCLQFLGAVQFTILCNYVDAAELLEESLRIYKALLLEESTNCMDTRVSAGELAIIYSRYDEAKDAFRKAATIYHKMKRRDREAYALINLGLSCLGLDDAQEALAHIRIGLVIWQEIPNNWGIGISYVALGDVALHEGEFSQAGECYARALSCFRDDCAHWKTYEAECLLKSGILLIRTEKTGAARETLHDSLQLYEETACRRGKASCLRQLAELDLKGSDGKAKREALTRLEFVEKEYSAMGLHVEAQKCALIVAGTYRSLGEKQPKGLQLQIKK